MALTADDWTIERDTKVIAYTGGDHDSTGGTPSYATVIQFHRWLQGLADDAVATAAESDELDITNPDPSRRSTDNIITLINGYTIGDTEAEHLYDGSIIQNSGDDIYDGIVNFGNSAVQIQIIQNGAVLTDDWWNYSAAGLNPNATAGISHRFMIKTRTGGADVDGRRLIGTCRRYTYTYSEFSINGTARGNNVLALTDSSDLNNETIEGTVSGWTTITNTTEGYVDLDVNNDGTDEHYYSEWNRDSYTINQFYERMKWLTRDASSSTLYGLNGELFRGITHQVAITDLTSGAWNEPEALSWGSGATAGTGQLFAIDNVTSGSATVLYMQLLTGVVPNANTITGATNSATGTAGTITERTISKPFCGASTGSAIIGSYGLSLETADLTSTDKVTDLGNVVRTPPNNVTNTVSGLIHGEDRVLLVPWDGSSTDTNGDPAIDKDQLTLDFSTNPLTTATETAVDVTTDIPSDTPSTGTIRITSDTGYETRVAYTSWATKQFTIGSTDFSDADAQATAANNVYISYVDELAAGTEVTAGAFVTDSVYVIKTTGTTNFTLIGAADSDPGTIFTATGAGTGTGVGYEQSTTATYTSVQDGTRNLVLIVRDGASTPIKQYISSWSQTSSASTISVIRTTDS